MAYESSRLVHGNISLETSPASFSLTSGTPSVAGAARTRSKISAPIKGGTTIQWNVGASSASIERYASASITAGPGYTADSSPSTTTVTGAEYSSWQSRSRRRIAI